MDPAAPATGVRELLLRRRRHMPHWLRLSRYTIGSIICFLVSEIVFVALFAPHLLGAKGASIAASIAGVIPGYYLNRTWTWGRRGKSDFWREVVPYWGVALVSAGLAALATGGANTAFADQSRLVRTAINAAVYMLTYGVIFVGKYLLFHKVLFRPPAVESVAAEPRVSA